MKMDLYESEPHHQVAQNLNIARLKLLDVEMHKRIYIILEILQ